MLTMPETGPAADDASEVGAAMVVLAVVRLSRSGSGSGSDGV